MFDSLIFGFTQALTFSNLLYCFIGVLLGTLIGILPGIGAGTTLSLILPLSFYLTPIGTLVMMAGVFYGAQYGGSTTSILSRVAGEGSSIPTIIEGNLLAKKGKAGSAICIAAVSSFFAGIVTVILISIFSIQLVDISLTFGPSEYFSICLFSLVVSIVIGTNYASNFALVLLGFLLGLVGLDIMTGNPRFTFGQFELYDGIGLMVFSLGIFGIGEICKNIVNIENPIKIETINSLYPTKEDFKRSILPTIRGTGIGSILGMFPGGALLSSFASYYIEKYINKNKFGKGAIEGVAGPEAANNAGAQSSFIPLLVLGIPTNSATAMLLGALVIHNYVPGPSFITQTFSAFWVLLASMVIGNIFLIILNIPLIGLWVKLLLIPKKYLNYLILVMCCVATYLLNYSYFEVLLMFTLGIFAYVFIMYTLDLIPLFMGFLLGPILEEQFRRSLAISGNNLNIFWSGYINKVVLFMIFMCFLVYIVRLFKNKITFYNNI